MILMDNDDNGQPGGNEDTGCNKWADDDGDDVDTGLSSISRFTL